MKLVGVNKTTNNTNSMQEIQTVPVKNRVETKCDKCGYVWTYKGRMSHYVCCPNCRHCVNLMKNKEMQSDAILVDGLTAQSL
jgi:acetyl-CoA carboxylase beta subunit